jgi:hypothetical protein
VSAMKKPRIEVTRERWTRISVESRGPAVCPTCRGAPDLAFVPPASEQTGLRADDINNAIRSGLLPLRKTQEGEALVCLGCLRKLREEKRI